MFCDIEIIIFDYTIPYIFVGKWRISTDNDWPAMEEISCEFLRIRTNSCPAVSIFYHLRSIFNG